MRLLLHAIRFLALGHFDGEMAILAKTQVRKIRERGFVVHKGCHTSLVRTNISRQQSIYLHIAKNPRKVIAFFSLVVEQSGKP